MTIESTVFDSILKTVQLYHDEHVNQDAGKLKKAFHPKSRIVGYFEGEAVFDDRDPYVDVISGITSEGKREDQDIKIISVDMTETTAVVKI
ncbi:MAG: hypothetical protein DRP70_16690 [Spirochaetes bacterium]|nr:MAG: hypothetical protein DRP70_16690 [Spirochaetota bacterium]RKX94846.1 MAG: hypothetical protein DRZ90_11215 [Spirochaetota bacterium]